MLVEVAEMCHCRVTAFETLPLGEPLSIPNRIRDELKNQIIIKYTYIVETFALAVFRLAKIIGMRITP